MKQLFVLVLAAASLSLSACGYQLRGYQSSTNQAIETIYATTPNSAAGFTFRQALKNELANVGFNLLDQANHTHSAQIDVHNLNFRQFTLVGTLTEVRVVGVLEVTYHLPSGSQSHTLTAERSYQYNEASVLGSDKQGERTRKWLEEELARRTAEQYYALTHP